MFVLGMSEQLFQRGKSLATTFPLASEGVVLHWVVVEGVEGVEKEEDTVARVRRGCVLWGEGQMVGCDRERWRKAKEGYTGCYAKGVQVCQELLCQEITVTAVALRHRPWWPFFSSAPLSPLRCARLGRSGQE
jgi:hypothetical protein